MSDEQRREDPGESALLEALVGTLRQVHEGRQALEGRRPPPPHPGPRNLLYELTRLNIETWAQLTELQTNYATRAFDLLRPRPPVRRPAIALTAEQGQPAAGSMVAPPVLEDWARRGVEVLRPFELELTTPGDAKETTWPVAARFTLEAHGPDITLKVRLESKRVPLGNYEGLVVLRPPARLPDPDDPPQVKTQSLTVRLQVNGSSVEPFPS